MVYAKLVGTASARVTLSERDGRDSIALPSASFDYATVTTSEDILDMDTHSIVFPEHRVAMCRGNSVILNLIYRGVNNQVDGFAGATCTLASGSLSIENNSRSILSGTFTVELYKYVYA